MKILNNGVEKDVKMLTYFKIRNESNIFTEYVIYTDLVNEGENVYVANVFHNDGKQKLIKPNPDMLGVLKKIISNLISNNPNNFVFTQNKYQYIDIKTLENIEQVGYQKISLNSDQYNNLLTCKYLTYPFTNLTNIKSSDGFRSKYSALADKLSIIISSILLLMIIGGLIAYRFNWNNLINNVFDFNDIMKSLLTFDLTVNNYLILQIAILALVLSLISYNVEKTKPITFFFTSLLLTVIIYIIWIKFKGYVDFNNNYINFLKAISIYSIFVALIITICYSLSKIVTSFVTNKFSFCNFITHYTMFLIIFVLSFIGLGLIYNEYILEYIQDFILNITK